MSFLRKLASLLKNKVTKTEQLEHSESRELTQSSIF